jgi:hypothetical protein
MKHEAFWETCFALEVKPRRVKTLRFGTVLVQRFSPSRAPAFTLGAFPCSAKVTSTQSCRIWFIMPQSRHDLRKDRRVFPKCPRVARNSDFW